MRQAFTAFLLGLTAFTSTAVQAEHRIDAAAFAMSVSGPDARTSSLTLLSDADGTARIAVKGFDGIEGYEWDAISREDYSPETINWGNVGLAFDVRDGYRITGMTLTGTLTGVLAPGVPPAGGSIGVTTNKFSMGWRFAQGDQSISMGQKTLTNVNGDQLLQLNADVPFEGDFAVALDNEISAYAQSGVSYWHDGDEAEVFTYHESYASAHWHDVVLTVQVSAVPEPATYAMLLGGLGIAGFAARRRKA